VGVYGIDFYGVGRFGPDPALVRPDFSVAPFDFLPLDYQSLHLTWKNPVSADCTQLRLVRNGSNLPQDENDGAQVFVLSNYATTNTNDAIVVGAITSLTDVHLAGGFQYYTMFGWSASSQVWVRCTDLIALVPLPWGYGWRMYNLMPMAYRDADIILVDPYNPWSTEGLPGGSPPLQRYLQLVGFQFDFIRTEMESLMSINDVANCSGALLPLMAQQLGLVHEPEVGMQQERQLVQNAVHLYKQKGSPRGITEMASILTSYPATQLVHHGYNELLCLDDGVMADAIGTWQVWPPRIPTDPITWNANPGGYTGTYTNVFAPLAGQAAGEALTWIPNLLSGSIANMTNPLETFGTPSTWPSSIQPPYQNSGMRVQGTGAGDYNLTTSGIPITDFLSQYGGPGNITWRIQVWSATARTVWLSVWGDVGSGTRVQVLPEQSFVETAGHWTTMTITGTMNPYPNSLPGASAPTGPASYYRLFPQIRIAGAAANEAHYVTICGLWPCTPAQIGIDTPTYDYPRDIKLLLQPQASNLLTNTVSTFSKINPSPPPSLLGIGFDGLTNTVDPNQPSTLNIIAAAASDFETGTTGSYIVNNCTLANSTAQANTGTHSLQITSTVIGSGTNRVYVRSPRMGATSNQVYTVNAYFRPGTTARQVAAYLVFFDSKGNALSAQTPPFLVTETAAAWVGTNTGSPPTTQVAPVGTTQMELRLEVQYPGAVNEIHYVDSVSVYYTNAVASCQMSIRYASLEDPPSLAPINGIGALQVTAIGPGATIWWGKVSVWSPPSTIPAGWFASSRPTPPPAYPAGPVKTLTNDWFFGAVQGYNPRNWVDPVWGWFMTNQTFFGTGSAVVNGIWFAAPPQPPIYGSNLSAYNVTAGQPFNFSIYAQYMTVQDPTNAQMQMGLRWYYPDGNWIETSMTVMLTANYVRYSMPDPNNLASYYLGEPPPEGSTPNDPNPPTGILPTLVYPFVRFTAAQNAQFLLNSAMLSPGLSLPPYMDATSYSSASGDFIQDGSGASYVYRRRTPRVARLNEQLYRWVPMGSTYSITYASAAVAPPLDPTTWP